MIEMYTAVLFTLCAVSVTFASVINNQSSNKFGTDQIKYVLPKKLYKSKTQLNSNNTNDSLELKSPDIPSTNSVKNIGQEHHRTELHSSEISKTPPNEVQKPAHVLYKIHATLTRSKDAVWATITLTFMCVLLVLAVAQSRMWKDYRGSEAQGVPLPNFNERVLFKDVMEHKIQTLKQFFKKRKKQEKSLSELESLLPPSGWESDKS